LCGIVPLLLDTTAVVLAVLSGSVAAQPKDAPPALQKVTVGDGVELHYVERGRGVPVVFVHRGFADYREWDGPGTEFAKQYRVIAYSRRYNYPNKNKPQLNHSAIVEAADLAALIKKLDLGKVHLVGYSYGAYTALFLAVKHPELVRTMSLAEPPVLAWLDDLPEPKKEEGKAALDEFLNKMWRPAGDAFRKGDEAAAIRTTIAFFEPKKKVDEGVVKAMVPDPNIAEWKARTTSADVFPPLDRELVKKIKVPTLLLLGKETLPVHKLTNDELERCCRSRCERGQTSPAPDTSCG
jgi:pimeloyl-ACP methyl ester carboxylesterase